MSSVPPANRPPRAPPFAGVDYETEALDRGSYITAIIHLYRGEVSRANTWRQRLDQSTNWAIFVTASALGFAFGNEAATHFSLLFTNIVLMILLGLESRRFRFFDVWRSRIRKIETNFFAPILRRELTSPERDWMLLVAEDLCVPHFHLTRLQAFRLRLVRNYLQIFAVVLLAWIIKLSVHPHGASSWSDLYERCAVGPIPGWITLVAVAVFYGGLVAVVVLGRSERDGRDNWDIGEQVIE